MNSQKQWTSMFIKTQSSASSGNQLSETSDSSTMKWPYSESGETSHNHALERETSQPKARTRWNPKPEQIRILEAIFQSGVVSPPREEIKRIRAQLEVFGQVGDINVFYWFQNRKSRSKRKPRLPAAQRSKSRTQSGTLSSTSSTSTSTSVNSKSVTEIYNSSPNSMHSNAGDQYYSSCATPISAFAENDYAMQAVYKEMSKTSISVPTKTLPNPSNSLANAMKPNIGDQYCFNSAAPLYSSAGNTLTSAPPETLLNSSKSPLNAMPANIGDQYHFSSAAPVSSYVNSKTLTEIYNNSPNSMHSNSGDQYYATCATPVSAFAENDYDMQAVYEEMSKTSISVPTKTLPNPSSSLANAMQANIGDQYCFCSAAPLYSSAGNHYDHLNTSTDQYCFSSAAPLYSSAGNQYDHLNTSTSAPPETLLNSSESPLNAIPANIGDRYCFSSAAPVSSSAGHHYDLHTVYDEMSNINELCNMQAIQATAAAAAEAQSIVNEGIGGVQEGSISNPNPSITVFINDVPTTIPSGPINFGDFFGNDGLLLNSSGESVLVNEFGLTSLEHGATYFLI